jgi:hypothetical protein
VVVGDLVDECQMHRFEGLSEGEPRQIGVAGGFLRGSEAVLSEWGCLAVVEWFEGKLEEQMTQRLL